MPTKKATAVVSKPAPTKKKSAPLKKAVVSAPAKKAAPIPAKKSAPVKKSAPIKKATIPAKKAAAVDPDASQFDNEDNMYILEQLAVGVQPKMIANELPFSHRTVETRIALMRNELKAVNVVHLIALAYQQKILS